MSDFEIGKMLVNKGMSNGIEAYKQGRADAIDELEQKLRVWDCKANAIPSYVWHCFNEMKEQKR